MKLINTKKKELKVPAKDLADFYSIKPSSIFNYKYNKNSKNYDLKLIYYIFKQFDCNKEDLFECLSANFARKEKNETKKR